MLGATSDWAIFGHFLDFWAFLTKVQVWPIVGLAISKFAK